MILFALGTVGLLVRRDLLFILMSIEVMLNAAGLAFVAAGARWGQPDGQVMCFVCPKAWAGFTKSLNSANGERPSLTPVIRHGARENLGLILRTEFYFADCPRLWLTGGLTTEIAKFPRMVGSTGTPIVDSPPMLGNACGCQSPQFDVIIECIRTICPIWRERLAEACGPLGPRG
jgi:hypothetical protein